jgi:Ethanolamine utilization protein EutJ (predicted chaperonin)
MRKYIAVVLLSAGMLIASTATNPTASAQGTKKDKDKAGKVDPKGGTGHIVIGKGKDGKYRFTVRNHEDKFLALSAPHATEKEVHEAIEAFRKIVANAKVTTKKEEKAKGDKAKD